MEIKLNWNLLKIKPVKAVVEQTKGSTNRLIGLLWDKNLCYSHGGHLRGLALMLSTLHGEKILI